VENLGGAPPNNRAKAIFNYDDFPDASLSLLQVTAIASGGVLNIGVHNWNLSPNMTNVTASASGSDGSTNYGVLNEGSSSKMTNVTASASGSGGAFNIGVSCINQPSPNMTNVRGSAFGGANSYGMFANNCAPRIGASDLSASGATNNYGVGTNGGGPMMINNSKITGSTNTIRNEAGGVIRVGASQLVGGSVINLGTISCSASYDENYFSPGLNVCP
jgi:hypothetical protein